MVEDAHQIFPTIAERLDDSELTFVRETEYYSIYTGFITDMVTVLQAYSPPVILRESSLELARRYERIRHTDVVVVMRRGGFYVLFVFVNNTNSSK